MLAFMSFSTASSAYYGPPLPRFQEEGSNAAVEGKDANSSASEDPELTLEQRRVLIARRIAQQVMTENNVGPKKIKSKTPIRTLDNLLSGENDLSSTAGNSTMSAKEIAELKAERSVRTLKVISDPKNSTIYSMEKERELVTNNKLDIVVEEVRKQYERNNTTIDSVVMILKKCLEEAFFGCVVNVGVMIDASNAGIEFISDPDYKRKVTRTTSTCFECIDAQDLVLKVNCRPSGSDISSLTEGETVVNVPLFGKGGPAGVIEILGMHSEGLTTLENYERPTAPMEAMMRAKDWKFKKDLRLWRMPGQKNGGIIRGKKKKLDMDASHIKVVCGKIYEIATEKNGVPYFGGPRYSIIWEDGLLEEGLTAKEFLELYVQTPQSLGSATSLDEKLIKDLLDFGMSVGETLENQRRKDLINRIKKKLNIPNLADQQIVDIALDSVMSALRGGRQAILVSLDEETQQYVELSNHFPSSKVSEKKFNFTVSEIISVIKESKTPEEVTLIQDSEFLEWIGVKLKLPNDYKYKSQVKFRTMFVVFQRSAMPNKASSSLDDKMCRDSCKLLAETLIVSFIRETRLRMMKGLLKTLEASMFEWRKVSIEEICYNSCVLVSQILPGADVYIGLLKEGGKQIYWMGSNNSSKMVGKSLMKGEGISFDIIQNLETIILQPDNTDKSKFLTANAPCNVLYGKKYYKATILEFRGHECYDVLYDFDKKVEAGVNASRITPINSAFRVKKFSPIVQFPYVGIAVRNTKKCIGVLGIDTFTNVPKAPYDVHPDPNVLHFVESCGKVIGGAIDTQRKRQVIKLFNSITKNPNAEMHEILDGAFDAMQSILFQFNGSSVHRAIYESDVDYFLRGQKKVERERGEVSFDARNKINLFDVHKSNLKPFQKITDTCILMVCRLKPEIRGREGKIYLITVDCTETILQPDLEFLDTLQKIITSALQGLVARKALSELKHESLIEIKEICNNWQSLDRHALFDMVAERVQSIFFSSNMYVGFLGMFNEEIKYVLASSHSEMKGKSLQRKKGKPYFLTFNAIDTNSRLCVLPHLNDLREKLQYFGLKDKTDFPIIFLPMLTHVDAVIGIFTIDSCEDPSTDGEKMDSTVSYFSNVGNYLVKAVHGYRLEDARQTLLDITKNAKTYRAGMREIKRLLLNLVPFAKRITDIVYIPRLDNKLESATPNEFLVLFHVVQCDLLVQAVKNPTINIIWQGKTLFKANIKKDAEKNIPFSFLIANQVLIDQIQLQMVVKGTMDGGNEKEICKKSLGFHYIMNSPVNVMEHSLDSAFIPEVHVAKVQVVSKVFDPNNIVALCVTDINVRGLPNTDTLSLTDAYVIIKWNDSIVYQTNVIDDNLDPHWENMEGNIEFNGANFENEVMSIEVWDSDLLGRGNFLGTVVYKGKDLNNVFNGLDSWTLLKPLASDHSGGNSVSDNKIQGRIKMNGYVMYARDMNETQRKKELDVVGLGDSKDAEVESKGEEERFTECELRILCAKNLLSKFTHPDTASINPFITVFFNGEEIGRTGVVENRIDPEWDEEFFSVRVPESDLQNCLLLIEVHHMSASGKGEFLGCCEITSMALVNLLSGTSYKRQWFDVRNYDGLGEAANLNVCGEVKLGGRPISIPIDGGEDDAIDLGKLELSVVTATNLLSPKAKDTRCFSEVTFNGSLVLVSGISDSALNISFPLHTGYFTYPNSKSLLQSNLKVIIFACNKNGDKGDILAETTLTSWDLVKLLGQKGCKTLWLPISAATKGAATDCELKLRGGPAYSEDEFDDDGREIWFDVLAGVNLSPSQTTGMRANNRPNPYVQIHWNGKLVFKSTVVNSSSNPMWEGQRSILRTPLIDGEGNSLLSCVLKIEVLSKGALGTIPLGVVELEGEELLELVSSEYAQVRWLKLIDIKEYARLKLEREEAKKAAVEAAVAAGTAGAVAETSGNIPNRERSGTVESGSGSIPNRDRSGTVESSSGNRDRSGSIEISNGNIPERNRSSSVVSVSGNIPSRNRSGSVASTNAADASDVTSSKPIKRKKFTGGEIKIKIGNAGEAHDPTLQSLEIKLQVMSCENLMKADAFSSTDPFYTVEWNNNEIGRSEVHSNDYNPKFDKESFILRVNKLGTIETQKLVVNIWDYNITTGNEFLGQALLTGADLVQFLSKESVEQKIELKRSADLTEEENAMVQGSVLLVCSKVQVKSESIVSLKTVVLLVVLAKNIGRTSKFHAGSDVFFKVIRRNNSEGSDEVEIYKSKVFAKTLDPEFNIEVSVKVPVDLDEWEEMIVRIELWDIKGDFLGCVTLQGQSLIALLNRAGDDCLVPVEYSLIKHDAVSAANQKLVQGALTLAGGDANFFIERKSKKLSIENILGGAAVDAAGDKMAKIDSSGAVCFVTIIRARDLGKADILLQKSDPFCVLYWNNKEIGKTAVIDSNVNPRWDDEVFNINLPSDDNPSPCKLDILVYDKDPGEDTGDFLGMLTLTGGDLCNLLDPETTELEYPLQSNPLFTPRTNKLVKGSIFISGKCPKFIEKAEAEVAAQGGENSSNAADGGGGGGGGKSDGGGAGVGSYKYKLSVASAQGLARLGFFGRPSDPYVNVYWCNDKTPVYTTKTISGSSDPAFNETVILDLPKGKNSQEYVLRFQLFHKNSLKADEFLGEVAFEGRALENLINLGKEETSELKKSSFFSEKQPNVKGSFKFRILKVSLEQLASSDINAACPVGMKDLELSIVAAAGLAKANTFGLSDPFCKVWWNESDLGENTVIEETLDPVWEDDNSKFSLRVSEIYGLVKEDFNTKRIERWKDPKIKAYDDAIEKYSLYIEVWDWNQFGPGSFLGCIELKSEDIRKSIEGNKTLRGWYDLTSSDRLAKTESQKLVQGKLQIMIAPIDKGDDYEGKDLDIEICSAKGLAKADTFGSADPYVKVRWNYKFLGKTEVIKDSLTPVWEDEQFKCRQPGSMNIEDCILYLELWDWDAVGGGNFLGSLKLEGERLKEIVETSNFSSNWFELGKSEYLPETLQDLVQGEIEIRIGYSGVDYDTADVVEKFEFHVFSASNLARADGIFGLSDPYVVCKWNNREIGRTPHIDRNLNPEWNNQFFMFQFAAADDPSKFSLLFEVWDHDLVGKGDFLGGYVITSTELKEWLDEAKDDTVTISRTLTLTAVKHMDISKQELVQQNTNQTIKVGFKKFYEKQVVSSIGKSLHMKFDTERDLNSGQPLIDLTIQSGIKLFLQPGLIRSCNPYCKVTWMNNVLGQTPITDNNNPIWTESNCFAVKLSPQAEKEESILRIDVFDKSTLGTDNVLGRIELSFWALIRLQSGTFQFLLRPTAQNQIIRGYLKLKLDFYYPYWDSCRHVPATKLLRKIRVFSGEEFPTIGDETPSTKCTILFNGSIKAKTMVVSRNNNPVWPQTQCLILIDLQNPIEVTLQVFHVDIREKREICIGQAIIPFDYFLRPPKEPFLVSLSTPAKKPPSKYKFTVSGGVLISISEAGEGPAKMVPYSLKYGQSLCSYAVEDVSASTTGKQDPKDILFDGALTTNQENINFGTSCGLNTIEAISRDPRWIVMPIRDIGLRIGKKVTDVYGTKPGYRYALALERDTARMNISDVTMLEDIIADVEAAMLRMRRKDIGRVVRERALARFIELLEDYVKFPDFSMEVIYNWLVDTIIRCIPGVSIIIGSAGSDFKSISYTCYESGSAPDGIFKFVLYEGQGNDFELIGRNPPRSTEVCAYKDLHPKPAERNAPPNKPILLNTFRPFYNTQFPRVNVPLIAGDVATGFFTIENFDKYKAGSLTAFNDQAECKKWLESVGENCGRIVYTGKENLALRAIETFVNLWCCERNTLILEILKQCFSVLNSCRLLEVWTVKPDPKIKCMAMKAPVPPIQQGRLLTISKIKIRKSRLVQRKDTPKESSLELDQPIIEGEGLKEGLDNDGKKKSGKKDEGKDAKFSQADKADGKKEKKSKKDSKKGKEAPVEEAKPEEGSKFSLKSMGSFISDKANTIKKSLSSEKLNEVGVEGKIVKDEANKIVPNPNGKGKLEPLEHTSSFASLSDLKARVGSALSKDPVGEMIKKNTNFVCGLYYSGIEQVQIPLTKVMDTKNNDSYLEFNLVQVVITTERSVTLTLFEVDENLLIINEYTGVVNFASFEEKSMTISLSSSSAFLSSDFDADLEFIWPPGMHSEASVAPSFDLSRLKSFEVTCVGARDLLAADSNGFSDPFCEVFWYSKAIGKSKVINESLTPTWNETFKLPYIQGKQSMLAIEVYDMNFMGKGSILGRVEIPFSQLISPQEGTIDLPLKHKMGVNAKKQTKVGGIITLKYTMDLYELVKDDEDDGGGNSSAIVTIPRNVWSMNTPAISLTISHANDLGIANMFGGSSDPFVVVYLSNSSEPLFRTKVIEANLSPMWEETFVINLGVSLDPSSTTISDFPSVRLEVYDYNRIAKGDFMGLCEISPIHYCSRKGNEYRLQKNPKLKEKQNKIVQGSITCTYKLVDNVKVIQKQGYKFSRMRTLLPDIYLEVQILRARDLMVANRVGGKSDPYVRLFYDNVEYGETAYKKGTIDPSWQDEKFVILLNADNNYKIGDLRLEVWDKDFFSEGDFMGEVKVASHVLLHPPPGNFDMELQPMVGKPKGKIKGKLIFKLNIRHQKQRLHIEPVDFIEIRPPPTTLTPKAIEPFLDPTAEAQRLATENYSKQDIPKMNALVEKLKQKQKTYESNPFTQTGILSEVHLGQLLSSYQREEHTILKIPLADWLFLPCNTTANTPPPPPKLKSGSMDLPEDLALVAKGKANLVDDDDLSVESKDLVPVPPPTPSKKSKDKKPQEVAPKDELENEKLYIVARYDSGQLPRRDLAFLQSISKVIHHGLNIVDKRASREKERKNLTLNIQTLVSVAIENIEAVTAQTIVDIETSLQRSVDYYMFDTADMSAKKCKKETGALMQNVHTDDFINKSLRLLRFGYAIQYFRGSLFILDMHGMNTSQMALINLNLVEEELSRVEGPDYVTSLYDLAIQNYKTGCLLVPIIAEDEIFKGLFVYSALDAYPTAIYQVKLRNYNDLDKGKKSENEKAEIANKIHEMKGLEDGVSQTICNITKMYASGMINVCLNEVIKAMKGFHIHGNQSQADVIKYLFRQFVKVYSNVQEISIWCVDVDDITKSNEIVLSGDAVVVNQVEEKQGGLGGLIKSLFGGGKKKEEVASTAPSLSIDPSLGPQDALQGNENVNIFLKSILAGCFGIEDPQFMMKSESENMSYGKWKEEKKYNDSKKIGKLAAAEAQNYAIRRAQELVEKEHSSWEVLTPIALLRSKNDHLAEVKVDEDDDAKSETSAVSRMSEKSNKSDFTKASGMTEDSMSTLLTNSTVMSSGVMDWHALKAKYKNKIFDETAAHMILKEIFRCGKQLKMRSFQVITGHFLCSVGENDEARSLLDEAFDPNFGKLKETPKDSAAKSADNKSSADEGDITGGMSSTTVDLGGSSSTADPLLSPKMPFDASKSPRSRDALMSKSEKAVSPRSNLNHIPGAASVAKPESNGGGGGKSPRPTAPLPLGPPPTPKVNTTATIVDKANPSETSEAKQAISGVGIAKPPEKKDPKEKKKKGGEEEQYIPGRKKYFITARSHGIGAASGFGVGGALLEKGLSECSALLDSILRKLHKEIQETKERAIRDAKKKLAPPPMGGDTPTLVSEGGGGGNNPTPSVKAMAAGSQKGGRRQAVNVSVKSGNAAVPAESDI